MNKIGQKLKLCILTIIVMSIIFVGCGKQKEEVMIYTSIYPDIIEVVDPELKDALPDISVDWFQAGTEKVVTKLTGEIEADKIQANILMVADPSYYLQLKDDDILMKYESPNLKDVVTEKDDDGYWTSVRISNMIIAYNTDKVSEDEAPKTWKDLLDPRWEGVVGMPNPLLSGSAFVAVGTLADAYGWEYFEKLKDNGLVVDEGNSAVQNKLITGEYEVCMILEENILKLADQGEPIKVIYPEDGTIMIPSPIAILKDEGDFEEAKEVVDWWLSKDGQEAIVSGWMHSVRDDIDPPKGAPALSSFIDKTFKVDWAKLNDENEQIKDKFRSIALE